MSTQATLGELQRQFTKDVAKLIEFASLRYSGPDDGLTFGEAYRTPQQALWNQNNGKGISNSLHTQRLAIDFNLILNGEHQTDYKAYRELGEFWKSLSDNHAWGGDFIKLKDGNHFSIGYQGRR